MSSAVSFPWVRPGRRARRRPLVADTAAENGSYEFRRRGPGRNLQHGPSDRRFARRLSPPGPAASDCDIALRAFRREGAKVHVCDVDEAALERAGEDLLDATRPTTDVSDRAEVARPSTTRFRARRARPPGQQRRHRRADGRVEEDRPGGVGLLPRGRHHRPFQLHAACGAAPQEELQRQHCQPGRRQPASPGLPWCSPSGRRNGASSA